MSTGTPSMLTESLAVLGIKEARTLIADSDASGDALAALASLVNSPITQRAITEHEDSFRTASDIAHVLGGLGTALLAERSVRECMCLSARSGGATFCGVHLAGAPTVPTAVARAAFWEGETGMVLEPEVASYVGVHADRWVAAAVAAPPQPAPEPEHVSIGL